MDFLSSLFVSLIMQPLKKLDRLPVAGCILHFARWIPFLCLWEGWFFLELAGSGSGSVKTTLQAAHQAWSLLQCWWPDRHLRPLTHWRWSDGDFIALHTHKMLPRVIGGSLTSPSSLTYFSEVPRTSILCGPSRSFSRTKQARYHVDIQLCLQKNWITLDALICVASRTH